MSKDDTLSYVIQIFRKAGGTLRMSEAVRLGVHRRDLYRLRDLGQLEILDRGLYRLADLPDPFILIAEDSPKM